LKTCKTNSIRRNLKMEMGLCPNNHYYDHSVHSECPYCKPAGSDVGATMPAGDIGKTAPAFPPPIGATVPVGVTEPGVRTSANNIAKKADSDRTQAAIKEQIGLDPVVGWLVCLEGKDKGRDYRMHADNNFIGRAENMDIVLRNDDTVSRVNHAIISYDARDRAYYFAQGSGRGIVRVNDKAVLSTVELKARDRIEIGGTKLLFVPLCGEDFNWLV
jgi:hypothetical protein